MELKKISDMFAEIKDGNEVIEELDERIYGRYTAEDIY